MVAQRSRPAPPEPAGPPKQVLEQVPDRAALAEFVRGRSPSRWRLAYAQGLEWAREEFVDVLVDRGGQIAELHYEDGRYVTVDVAEEIAWIEEVTG